MSDQKMWPPTKWTCPNPDCKKDHSKPHFAYPGQVNEKKPLGEPGRVKFNREGSGMDCGINKEDTPTRKVEGETGPAFNDDGIPNGLFCPHCGWLQEVISIVRTGAGMMNKIKGFLKIKDVKCCMKGCTADAVHVKEDVGFCEVHFKKIVK